MTKRPWFTIEHDVPPSGVFSHVIARFLMWLCGWKTTGNVPSGSKFILIGAPHTSNWDFILMFGAAYSMRIKVSWIGKETIFKKPFGTIMKKLGGIPLDRSTSRNMVQQTIERFNNTSKLIIVMGPSGTRSKREHWKSGFYWMAHNAKVPILCSYVDFGKKVVHVGLSFIPTGDVKKDMDRIREFYKGAQGKKPELVTPVRLIDEEEG